jgi:protein-disulfide isomerase
VNEDLKKLREQFGDQVSLVFKDFPLPMHQFASRAAEAARCAGVQGKFWEYHDSLFETKKLHTTELKQEARALKLDGDRFDKCLDSGAETAVVKKDSDEALKLGLSGTPSFFINNHFMTGSIGYDKLRETVTLALAQANAAKKQSAAALVPATDGVEKK